MPSRRPITLDTLRRFAVARSLGRPTTLQRALNAFGFVQADPIRAPARAQDLTLRHRARDYRAGDLERRYTLLDIEEDVFVNYGFVTREVQALMHPRLGVSAWTPARKRKALELLEFVRAHGAVHPRMVDEHFSHGTVTNYWGGSSSATTHLLDEMHYHGLLRIARRDRGVRIYAIREPSPPPADVHERRTRIDALVDVAVHAYAPLPGATLSYLVARLRYAVPQWRRELRAALQRARHRLSHERLDGIDWYWPSGEDPRTAPLDAAVRMLAPFDPIVWDRRRFELLWGWSYRFEAYTPAPKRKLGYYALPLLWRDHIVGWANVTSRDGDVQAQFGYVTPESPRDRQFVRELDAELDRMRAFLQSPD
jgi:uncharacterized protein